MRDDPLDVRIPLQRSCTHEVQDRAGGIGDVLKERRGTGGEDALGHGRRKRGMDGHHRGALVRKDHERLQRGVSQVDAIAVAGELDAQGTQLVQAAAGLLHGLPHGRHRQQCAEAKASRMTRAYGRELVVYSASQAGGLLIASTVDVRRRDGEHAELLVGLLHEGEVAFLAPGRRGKPVLCDRVHAQLCQGIQVGGRQCVRVDVDACCKCNGIPSGKGAALRAKRPQYRRGHVTGCKEVERRWRQRGLLAHNQPGNGSHRGRQGA